MHLERRLCSLAYDRPPCREFGLHADTGRGDFPHTHRHGGDEGGRRDAPGDNHHRGSDNAHEEDIRHEGAGDTDHEMEEDRRHEGGGHTHHEEDDSGHVGGDTRENRSLRKRGEGIHVEGDDAEEGKNHPDTHAHDEDTHVAHRLGTRARGRGTHAPGLDTLARGQRGKDKGKGKDRDRDSLEDQAVLASHHGQGGREDQYCQKDRGEQESPVDSEAKQARAHLEGSEGEGEGEGEEGEEEEEEERKVVDQRVAGQKVVAQVVAQEVAREVVREVEEHQESASG